MQHKFCSRDSGSFLLERTGPACRATNDPLTSCDPLTSRDLPFRCHRCGERQCFHSLNSLRVHLERRHSYHSPDVISAGFSITGKLPDPLMAAIPWYDTSLPTRRGQQSAERPPHVRSLSDSRDSGYLHSYSSVRRCTHSVGVGTQEEDDEEDEDRNEEDIKISTKKSDTGQHHFLFPPLGPPPDLDPDLDPVLKPDLDPVLDPVLNVVEQKSFSGVEMACACACASVCACAAAVRRRRRLSRLLQRRLSTVSTELVHTDTELLCERAHSQQLIQERQEVAERQRSLSRQVDVAVVVIAALREQINASENELERREREVITIQKFLETAARQETSGKVRIQRFIENLLRRIDVTERLVEYYQQQSDNRRDRIIKSRSAVSPLSSGCHDNRTHSSHFSGRPLFCKVGGDQEHRELQELRKHRENRELLAQSSKLFCRPEHREDIWNHRRRRSTGYET
ncbi:F-box only protein 41 [Solea solea]|uniref:F-box only protein 41 n=1 Tax=Solea solea TaxID=90069 RepID=UPI00272C1D1F|nr:F-box only protein 41 [Solea solea]